ncbi:hypothetical protein BD414DRAFT_486849 [Trametes punicea]|nr:hypothetical protein BD414DRAFT_486849 [Trametes punicea]
MADVAANNDMLTELLITQLLEADMKDLENARAAEQLQLSEATRASADPSRFTEHIEPVTSGRSDEDVVLEILSAEISESKDALIAQALQHAEESNVIASRQYAQRLAAAEKKYALDAEFARRLQEAIDVTSDDEEHIDMEDAESMLGQRAIEDILASDLNEKGKGKPLVSIAPPSYDDIVHKETASNDPYPTCGICMEPFQETYSPVTAARSANSSARLQFGTRLPCPGSHSYCISCLNSYIHSKLDPDGMRSMGHDAVVFPIRCPECPITQWPEGITDAVAEKVLSEKGMVLWHHQKLLDSLPRFYCPNPRCSTRLQLEEDSDDPQALCPSCDTQICVPCRVIWHADLSCEEYQALPLGDRSPEDQAALRLIKAENWRRCPSCSFIVELTVGCHHITCRCKTEFCFKCGSLWDTQRKCCSREPSCELWEEDMLLEERERERELEQQARPVQHHRIGVAVALPAPPPYVPRPVAPERAAHRRNGALSWMDDPDVLCTRHWFTRDMVNTLTCQYCGAKLTSLADLRYHLSNVRRHAVYACCGRFFKRQEDYDNHVEAETRLRIHGYRFIRN